jgi:hypothetical protein
MSRLSLAVALALACVVGSAAPTHSEPLEITGYVGQLIPVQSQLINPDGSSVFRQKEHTLLGLIFGIPISDRFAVELVAGFGGGHFELVAADASELGSAVWIADLRARLRLLGGDAAQLALLGGVGYTHFRNSLFDAFHQSDDENELKGVFTGVVGLGLRGRVTDRVLITMDVVDRIHEQGIELAPGSIDFEEPTQHDIGVTAGLTFQLQ